MVPINTATPNINIHVVPLAIPKPINKPLPPNNPTNNKQVKKIRTGLGTLGNNSTNRSKNSSKKVSAYYRAKIVVRRRQPKRGCPVTPSLHSYFNLLCSSIASFFSMVITRSLSPFLVQESSNTLVFSITLSTL